MSLTKKHRIIFWTLFITTLVLDQVVKGHVRKLFNVGESLALIPNVLDYTLQYNKGIAFGMLQGMGVLLAPVAIMIAVLAMVYSHRHPREGTWTHIAMALLASGAIGNLYDRIAHGQVTDMFWIRMFEFPVFNIADSCITVAASILILKWGKEAFLPTDQEPEREMETTVEVVEPAHESAAVSTPVEISEADSASPGPSSHGETSSTQAETDSR